MGRKSIIAKAPFITGSLLTGSATWNSNPVDMSSIDIGTVGWYWTGSVDISGSLTFYGGVDISATNVNPVLYWNPITPSAANGVLTNPIPITGSGGTGSLTLIEFPYQWIRATYQSIAGTTGYMSASIFAKVVGA